MDTYKHEGSFLPQSYFWKDTVMMSLCYQDAKF